MSATILVVDDEKNIRRTLRMVLEGEKYNVLDAQNKSELFSIIDSSELAIDVVLLDVRLGMDNGIEILRSLQDLPATSKLANAVVCMISGHATIEDAVIATKAGAFDFLQKPLARSRVVVTVRNAVEQSRMRRKMQQLAEKIESRYEILGNSEAIETVRRQMNKVAPTQSRVLITGPSGTGKELIARGIHRASSVSQGEFVRVNCAAIPSELIESELFGHKQGAFTGAIADRRGLFEIACNGTLFLDEVGDMPLPAQAKVLRVLQTGEFNRVGGEKTLITDCRVVAATNQDLAEMVANKLFREDLYFRLNVVPIVSPKLSERKQDIPLLAATFVKRCCVENGISIKPIEPKAMSILSAYDWPGNVRELSNVIERLVVLSEDVIRQEDVPSYILGGNSSTTPSSHCDFDQYKSLSLREFRDNMEKAFIEYHLQNNQWNISQTARVLGIERTNLHKKLKTLGLHRLRY